MKLFSKSLAVFFLSLLGLSAHAEEFAVFVSCYADNGAMMTMAFDTKQTSFSYHYQKGAQVIEFESSPHGVYGPTNSSVTKVITENRKILKAHLVGGDAEQPLIATHAEIMLERDQSGSLRLKSSDLHHFGQSYNLDEFNSGSCYVQ